MAANRLSFNIFLFGKNGIRSVTRQMPNSTQACNNLIKTTRNLSLFIRQQRAFHVHFLKPLIIGISGSLFGAYVINEYIPCSTVNAKADSDDGDGKEKVMSRREQRFRQFASCEYNGQIVMTPHDFIESLIENEPRLSRIGKFRVTGKDVEKMILETPSVANGSNTFFRDLHQDGIITYSEYLFLVTILTKSNAGLKTALKMIDVNGDEEITLEEFRLIERMINKSASYAAGDNENAVPCTTICLHLFGEDGKRIVSFTEFFKFMDDLQNEVLELEFHEYSKSLKSISEVDFAKILLRNTTLTEKEYCEYLDRLISRIEQPKGVTMAQFKSFHAFLSNIEDFIIAVNMTNVVGQPVDKELFQRAVQVTTGEDIDPYIIDVVFSLFDNDGDCKLSQNEFIGIMKDRLKRGFGKYPNMKGLPGFKYCLKKEMIKSAE